MAPYQVPTTTSAPQHEQSSGIMLLFNQQLHGGTAPVYAHIIGWMFQQHPHDAALSTRQT